MPSFRVSDRHQTKGARRKAGPQSKHQGIRNGKVGGITPELLAGKTRGMSFVALMPLVTADGPRVAVRVGLSGDGYPPRQKQLQLSSEKGTIGTPKERVNNRNRKEATKPIMKPGSSKIPVRIRINSRRSRLACASSNEGVRKVPIAATAV